MGASPLSFPGDAPSPRPGGTAGPPSPSTACHQDRFKTSLEPSGRSSPSGQGPVPWERQEWDRILGRSYVRGERGGLGLATTPQSAISLSSRNIHEAPAVTCMPGPGLPGECLHSLSSGAHSLAGERKRERGAFTQGKSRARRAPGSQGLGGGAHPCPETVDPPDPRMLLWFSSPLPSHFPSCPSALSHVCLGVSPQGHSLGREEGGPSVGRRGLPCRSSAQRLSPLQRSCSP